MEERRWVELYRIRPLKQAQIAVPLGVVFMLGDMSRLINGPVFVWYVEGNDRKILIDAGVEEPKNGFVHGFPVLGGGEKGIREALGKVGVKPEDIDTLILTHLHFDHVATATLFHNAGIYVQKKEWKSAFDPPLHYRLTYDPALFQPLENMDLRLVKGDKEIVEGIELVLLPGHTKGLQGVAIETAGGKYLVAGDHFYSFANLNPPKEQTEVVDSAGNKIQVQPIPLSFAPPGLHVDLTEWYDSCFKAISIAGRGRILPGHEPTLEGKVIP